MVIHFLRTGEKRYAVEIERDGLPLLEMNPAPGYDPRVPHDMMHLIVEAALGLERAVFGQLAAGGDAGTFHIKQGPGGSSRDEARRRRKLKKRGDKIKGEESGDFARSERATFVVWREWLMRSGSDSDRRKAAEMSAQAEQIRSLMAGDEKATLDRSMDAMIRHADEISARWERLAVGSRLTLRWPDLRLLEAKHQ